MGTIYTGQSVAKDCVVGDRTMNRYCVFNGLEQPMRIDSRGLMEILGVRAPVNPTLGDGVAAGDLVVGKYYGYQVVYASSIHTRPVADPDGSLNYTRGNPSDAIAYAAPASGSISVSLPAIAQDGITHILVYRSTPKDTAAEALAGPFFYATKMSNTSGTVSIDDIVGDGELGLEVEYDNFQPSAWRYALAIDGYIFAGGNTILGPGYTCEVTLGSEFITANADLFYNGIDGWTFKIEDDTSGGVDEGGLYYATYVDARTLRLTDGTGASLPYNGTNAGTEAAFTVWLNGSVMRWSKFSEPEAWPTTNAITFEGNILGFARIPGQSLVMVCTDTPSMYVYDLNLLGTASFRTQRHTVSTEFTVTNHFLLSTVESRIRGLDITKKCIWETDGTLVRDITTNVCPRIFDFLSQDPNDHMLWHSAYDKVKKMYGAFVTYRGALKRVDFCIGQHVDSQQWFFNWEKDLLCTAEYRDPLTNESMILGGCEGGMWGRIWTPDVWSDWLPSGCIQQGTIVSATDTTITIDTSGGSLPVSGSALQGRWVLVCDENEEYSQVAYISGNTSDTITIDGVLGSTDNTKLTPVPEAGWKFYLGLIEMRWGPRRYEFGDPDGEKQVHEVWITVEGDGAPFLRLFRGYDQGYEKQVAMSERVNMDGTGNASFLSRLYEAKMQPLPRWGMAIHDRTYEDVHFHSMSIVFNRLQGAPKKK